MRTTTMAVTDEALDFKRKFFLLLFFFSLCIREQKHATFVVVTYVRELS